jgi:hypothetical protein
MADGHSKRALKGAILAADGIRDLSEPSRCCGAACGIDESMHTSPGGWPNFAAHQKLLYFSNLNW